ncbi:MAG: hypothetical protein EXR75_02985 [Myxococcales bacterium]|nr:hypothetical protein [Myxococcales bacterium]
MHALGLMSFISAAACYLAASAFFYLDIVRVNARFVTLAPVTLGVAATAHACFITVASFVAHVCPVHSVEFILSVAALVATVVYLALRNRFRIHALGILVAPVGLVLTLATYFLRGAAPGQRLPASFIGLHVLANLTGLAMFLLASGAAVLYLVQERRLKRKSAAVMGTLPSLDALDRAVHRFLIAGFPLLTLGVVSGTVWSERLSRDAPQELLRAVLSYTTWLLFAAVLLLRVLGGWRGRRAAYGTVAGFACALMVLTFYLVRPLLGRAEPPLRGALHEPSVERERGA